MKRRFFVFIFIPVVFFTLLNCSDRNITEVLEPPLPQGERLFDPNWELTSALDNSDVTALELSFNTYVIAGSENGNFFRSKYNGDSWDLIPASNYPITIIHRAHTNFIFAGNTLGELFISSHNGREWEKAAPFNSEINSITTLSDNSVWIGTDEGLFYSEGNSMNFLRVNASLLDNARVYSVLNYKNDILIAGINSGILKSTDKGVTWSKTDLGKGCLKLTKNIIGELYAGTEDGIYSSKNGDEWTFKGLQGKQITALTVTKNIHMFAGTSRDGMYYSHNNGANWSNFGLDNKRINSILEHPIYDMILACVGNNVYRIIANSGN